MQGDVIVDKENVGPRGTTAWSQQAMLAKNRGLGAGHDLVRKEKSGVLASNATTNNGGGAGGLGSLELLKERVKLLKLSSTNGASGDSGSRLQKHRSPLMDIKSFEGVVNSSAASLQSKDGAGYLTVQERSSSQSQEIPSFSKLSRSRAFVPEQPERNFKSSLHSSGGNAGSKFHWSGSLKVRELYQEDTTKQRREASRSRVEAWVNAAGLTQEHRGSNSPLGSGSEQHERARISLGTTHHHLESKTHNPQRSSTSRDSSVWSGAKRQGTPYKQRLPLAGDEIVGKIIQEDEAQSNNNESRVTGHVSPAAAVSLKASQNKEVEYFEERENDKKVGVRLLGEENLKSFGSLSWDGVSGRRTSEHLGSGILTPAELQSGSVGDLGGGGPSEKRITFEENIGFTRSSGVWAHSEPGFSTQEDQHEKSSPHWASYRGNTDATTVAPSSAFLHSKMTGASSSGSSATPRLSGDSSGDSRDDDTVGYSESWKQQTPSTKEHANPSSRERMSSRTRISKRLKPLGPASRLLMSGPPLRVRVPVEDLGSRVPKDDGSPNSLILSPQVRSSSPDRGVARVHKALSPLTTEEADTNFVGDLKKRKAEDDPSIGDVSHSGNECSTGNKSNQSALPSASDLLKDVHRSYLPGLNAMVRRETCSLLPGSGKVEECGPPNLSLQQRLESANDIEFKLVKKSSLADGDSGQAQSPNSKSKNQIHNISTAGSKLSRGEQEKPYRGLGSLHNFKDMVSAQQGQLAREVAVLKHPIDRLVNPSISSLHVKPKNSPSSDARRAPSELDGSRISSSRKATSDGREGSEAVSMSQDGLFFRDKSDTRPGSVQDLSNSLGSLSLGERDAQTKPQSRPPLQNLVNTLCANPPVAPVNQGSMKSLENFGGFPNTIHSSGRSAVTTENENRIQNPTSLPCEKGGKELSGASEERHIGGKDLEVEESLKPAPVEISGTAASNDSHFSEEPRKEDGEATTVAAQGKVAEDGKFFWVNDERYQKLGMIGKGGSSKVYKVIDSHFSIYALKKITLGGRDRSMALGFYQEIEYLERLRGKRHIIQLIAYGMTNRFVVDENYGDEKIQEDACIYMVLEFGEIDLAGILSKKRKEMLETSEPLDDNWIRFYWKHMLSAVKTIHDERIVHADLKPANFLLVKGELKLIDFGIAKAIQTDTTHVVRDSQVGTLNYMPPEALMNNNSTDEEGRVFKCGRSSDIWSLGCILYQMVYGQTPYSHIRTMYAKIQAITSENFKIDYPPIRDPWLLDVMKRCLTWDRHSRPDIAQLLVHPFLRPDLAGTIQVDIAV